MLNKQLLQTKRAREYRMRLTRVDVSQMDTRVIVLLCAPLERLGTNLEYAHKELMLPVHTHTPAGRKERSQHGNTE